TRGSSPPLGNRGIPRAGAVHRSGIAEFHAQERSIARESWNPTRGRSPPPRNRKIPRAGAVHRPEKAESHAQERSTAREKQNPTRGRRSIEHEHRLKPL